MANFQNIALGRLGRGIPSDISPWEAAEERNTFLENVWENATDILNVRNWLMATGAVAGSVARELGGLPTYGNELEQGQWIDPATLEPRSDSPQSMRESLWASLYNAPTLPQLWEGLKDPYTHGMQHYADYAYKRPIDALIDASLVASIGSGIFRSVAGGAARTARATAVTRAGELSEALTRGADVGVIRGMAEALEGAQATRQRWLKLSGVRGAAQNAPIKRDLLTSIQRFVGRAPEQKTMDSFIALYVGEAQHGIQTSINAMRAAMKGLKVEDIPRLVGEFVPLTEFGYNEAKVLAAASEGRLLPQTVKAIEAWNKIEAKRMDRWIEGGLISEAEAAARARIPAEVSGIATDIEWLAGEAGAGRGKAWIREVYHVSDGRRATPGLGAGLTKPGIISVTTDIQRANVIQDRLRMVSRAARNEAEISEILEWARKEVGLTEFELNFAIDKTWNIPTGKPLNLDARQKYALVRSIDLTAQQGGKPFANIMEDFLGHQAVNPNEIRVFTSDFDMYKAGEFFAGEAEYRVPVSKTTFFQEPDPFITHAKPIGLSTRQGRSARKLNTEIAEVWGEGHNWARGPEMPNPLVVRENLKLISQQPELFMLDDGGRFVSPIYYPHYQVTDIVAGVMRDTADNLLSKPLPGIMKKSKGQLFRQALYDTMITETLPRNIRTSEWWEGTVKTLEESVRLWGKRPGQVKSSKTGKMRDWKFKDPVPENMVAVWPEGFRAWFFDGGMVEQIQKMARQYQKTGTLGNIEERLFANQVVESFTGETSRMIRKGPVYFVPKEVANHMKYHMAPGMPAVEVFTDFAGATSFWRHFVLSFRPAWQAVNEVTNTLLTLAAGNASAYKYLRNERLMSKVPGSIRGATILPEIPHARQGRAFGYSYTASKWLDKVGFGVLNDWTKKLHSGALGKIEGLGNRSIWFNQMRDDTHRIVNVLAESRRAFGKAGRTRRGIKAGGKLFTAEEAREIGRGGEAFIDAMEHVFSNSRTMGKTAFLEEMVSKAGKAVYTYNRLTPWQRRYVTRVIPFSGWQLFTTGLLMRLPIMHPGRAAILRSMANMGQDYVNELYKLNGVDPATLPNWNKYEIPLFVNGDGNVLMFKANFFRLYDMLETRQVAETFLSHPDSKFFLELTAGIKTFPNISPLSRPPEERGDESVPRRPITDILLERWFGSLYQATKKSVHPYAQYDTGGILDPQPVEIQGERIESGYGFAPQALNYMLGTSFRERGSYDLMRREHSNFRDSVDGMFTSLENELLKDDPDMDAAGTDMEEYLERANIYIDQTVAMLQETDSERESGLLRAELTTYQNRIERVYQALQFHLENPLVHVSAEAIHGEGWRSPRR